MYLISNTLRDRQRTFVVHLYYLNGKPTVVDAAIFGGSFERQGSTARGIYSKIIYGSVFRI